MNKRLRARRQAARFRAEQERISRAILNIAVAAPAAGLDREQTRIVQLREAGIQVCMNYHIRQIVIIESGAPQALVVQTEAQRLDQMQRRARVCAESNGISGIPGYFRFE
jgi:hypothetical protein